MKLKFKPKEKITIQEWLEFHPYKRSTDVDVYYVKIANKIFQVLKQFPYEWVQLDDEQLREVSCCFAAYLEDVVSQTGIWQSFTSEHKNRTGKFLPFYQTDDNYFQDEINKEDVRFLMWHYIQIFLIDDYDVNPLDCGIETMAQAVYETLEEEFETVPENENLRKVFEDDFDSVFKYRNLLTWFHENCYLNIGNRIETAEIVDEIMEENKDTKRSEYIFYEFFSNHVFTLRNKFFTLTSPEWMAKILANHPKHEIFANIQHDTGFFLVKKTDEKYVYAQSLLKENQERCITRESIDLSRLNLKNDTTVLSCSLVYYDKIWWLNGALSTIDLSDAKPTMDEVLEKEKKLDEYKRDSYKKFMKINGGVPFKIFHTKEEYLDFFDKNFTTLHLDKVDHDRLKDGSIIWASPKDGLVTLNNYIKCIKTKENKLYDHEYALEYASQIYTSFAMYPFRFVCYLKDNHLLPDAHFFTEEGLQQGKDLLNENWDFIIAYYLKGSREKDLGRD